MLCYEGCEAYICNMAIGWQHQAVKAEEAEKNAGAFLCRGGLWQEHCTVG